MNRGNERRGSGVIAQTKSTKPIPISPRSDPTTRYTKQLPSAPADIAMVQTLGGREDVGDDVQYGEQEKLNAATRNLLLAEGQNGHDITTAGRCDPTLAVEERSSSNQAPNKEISISFQEERRPASSSFISNETDNNDPEKIVTNDINCIPAHMIHLNQCNKRVNTFTNIFKSETQLNLDNFRKSSSALMTSRNRNPMEIVPSKH